MILDVILQMIFDNTKSLGTSCCTNLRRCCCNRAPTQYFDGATATLRNRGPSSGVPNDPNVHNGHSNRCRNCRNAIFNANVVEIMLRNAWPKRDSQAHQLQNLVNGRNPTTLSTLLL